MKQDDRREIGNTFPDLDAVVTRKFISYAGESGELAAETRLRDDLGLESIELVIILLDLADEFNLDLASPAVAALARLHTVADVVRLVRELHAEAAATSGPG